MGILDREKQYKELLSDNLYDRLLLRTKEPNIFKILGVSDYEIRHSNFLGWLLDPNESHGLNDLFLQRVLQDVLIDERAVGISIIELSNLNISKVEVRREWKDIDILIITDNFVVCIENKMWSGESEGQLSKYSKIVNHNFPNKKKCFVFLSPSGFDASDSNTYISYSYKRISEILESIIDNRSEHINSTALQYIQDYLTILRQNVMNNDDSNNWARQLYKNHKNFFDFVFENKPDIWDDFAIILNEKVQKEGWVLGSKNKGYVRFIPKSLESLILKYNKSNGWPNKEAFLFEIDFNHIKRLSFRSTVSNPIDYYDYDYRIVEILSELEGAKDKLGTKWKCHFNKSVSWDLEKFILDEDKKQEQNLNRFLEEIKPIVAKVENQLLKHKEELIRLKEGINIYE
ncbi:PD-(D/E)XK nuclease family protein [Muricauda ruestringensis]|uniref:PDDEXK-like family protein n=1 Tax=Flagellimonas ruestringensis TaxID=111501 RepID=UPI001CD67065|nr:PD-(D/E)XK nuclease family protein [Allomuricauda ruestringensis]MCA0960205.1 PD-(D/E)XK nuclease family protein [Allomuricauda ruestringensis]